MARNRPTFSAVLLGLVGLVVLFALAVAGVAGLAFLAQALGLEATLLWTTIIGGLGYLIKSNPDRTRAHESLLAEEKRRHYFAFLRHMNEITGVKGAGPNKSDASGAAEDPERIRKLRLLSLRIMMIDRTK